MACGRRRRRHSSTRMKRRPNLTARDRCVVTTRVVFDGRKVVGVELYRGRHKTHGQGTSRGDPFGRGGRFANPDAALRPWRGQTASNAGHSCYPRPAGGRRASAGPPRCRLSFSLAQTDLERSICGRGPVGRDAGPALFCVPRRAVVAQRQPGRRLRPFRVPSAAMSTSSSTSRRSATASRRRACGRLTLPDPFPGFFSASRTAGREAGGSMRIASADPDAAPIIDPNYLVRVQGYGARC